MTDNPTRTPYIMCCTAQGRAVIFGWLAAEPVPGQPVTIHDARMVLRWEGTAGLFGVAAKGPETGSRITAVVPRVTESVWAQAIACTPKAAAAIAGWPAC